jgi:iron complex outermembrane recepter protein
MRKHQYLLKPSRLSTSISAALSVLVLLNQYAPVAFSAEAEEDERLEEIVVTGSRIRRQDFDANSPVITIDQSTFENTSSIGVSTVLNQLPQFVPAVTQFSTSDVQNTAINTVGASLVSLRGLGANRNLVLIDGKRGQPINPTMVVDTNMIPSAAIQRVEIISGGASAVYGADAVGGVVNFILKDDFEGAQVEMRYGDTFDGGGQESTFSGLIGANSDRGNVMMGIERSTRGIGQPWMRDWRIEDAANPSAGSVGGTFFGSDTYISNVPGTPYYPAPTNNLPSQIAVNALFNKALPCTALANPNQATPAANCPQSATGGLLGVTNNTNFYLNRGLAGTVFTGLMSASGAPGAYRYTGPIGLTSGDHYGNFGGLPFRIVQPDGRIKENTWWGWTSTPLERLSSFAKGEFEISENIRMKGQAMFTRTETQTQLALTADTIGLWGAEIPFGTTLYRGDEMRGIPNSWNDSNANGLVDGAEVTNPSYLPGGRFQLNCNLDGKVGCTESEAFPLPPEMVALMSTRRLPQENLWMNRPPDWLRQAEGGGRRSESTTNIMQLSIGLEGELADGRHSWDISLSSGRTDNLVIQKGSARLSQWRAIATSPNFGRGFTYDSNPYGVGFAESSPTCETGLPLIVVFSPSADCIEAISPSLKNQDVVTQTVFEVNLIGDLLEMNAGPLSYAVGTTYREADFTYSPDNLSLNQNFIDTIGGLFPNGASDGKFDVGEVYGELLVPIVADGPFLLEHLNFEIGARASNWSMPDVKVLASYKALLDWAITPNYRVRGGWNVAHRAPNMGELFLERTQVFGGSVTVYGDQCSQRNQAGPYSANPAIAGAKQAAQTLAICRAMMGGAAANEYYDNRPLIQQPLVGGTGTPNSFGNPKLKEEQADTFTLGVAMKLLEDINVTVDYYKIEISDMISVEGPDTTHQRCLSLAQNPSGSPDTPACVALFRDPVNGNPSGIDLGYTNTGFATVSGVDVAFNMTKQLSWGGLNLNIVANKNLASLTQDSLVAPERDWRGTQGCALQIQCQGYDYRLFTTLNYFRDNWGTSLRHQYWPDIKAAGCITAPAGANCLYGGVQTDYHMFSLSGNYQIGERYTLRVGIENLLDKAPPLNLGDPTVTPFPTAPTHVGGGATYDPLGRRAFISLTMNI